MDKRFSADLTSTSSGRERIYAVLFESKQPLSAVEASRLSGLPLQQARNRINELIRINRVANVGSQRDARYVAVGAHTVPMAKVHRESVAAWRTGDYKGEKPMPVRPGSLDFLNAPSLDGDGRRDRRRPMLISSQGERK